MLTISEQVANAAVEPAGRHVELTSTIDAVRFMPRVVGWCDARALRLCLTSGARDVASRERGSGSGRDSLSGVERRNR